MSDIVVKNKSNVGKRGVHSYRQRYASSQWSKFIADSLGCAPWVHNILTNAMTRIVVDKSDGVISIVAGKANSMDGRYMEVEESILPWSIADLHFKAYRHCKKSKLKNPRWKSTLFSVELAVYGAIHGNLRFARASRFRSKTRAFLIVSGVKLKNMPNY